jgi:chloramphenicol 3-O-phosphotransferase
MTLQEFSKVACDFWTLCGEKTFWENPRKIELAKKAIGVSYLNVTEDIETAAIVYEAAMLNFTMRATYMGVEF